MASYISLREERSIRLFENRILRQIFKSKRDENLEWRMLHNEEFRIYSVDLIRKGCINIEDDVGQCM